MKVNLIQQSSSAVYWKGQRDENSQDTCEKGDKRTCSISCWGMTVKLEVKLEVINIIDEMYQHIFRDG